MEVLSDNSESESNNESESNKSKLLIKSNIFKNINLIIIRIYNMILKYPFLYYFLKFQIYILFCIGIYYLSRRTSLLMSPYLMNNEYYRKIRGIHDIATN